MTAHQLPFGVLLRRWRERRRMTQADLAYAAESSTRHLSCLETGKAQPSREMIARLADYLEIPLRDQNSLLAGGRLRAGFSGALARGVRGGENRDRRHPSGAQALSRLRGRPALECRDVEFRLAPTLRGLFGRSHAPASQCRAPHPASGRHGVEDRELRGLARPYVERASPADRRPRRFVPAGAVRRGLGLSGPARS